MKAISVIGVVTSESDCHSQFGTEFTFDEQTTRSSWPKGQFCIVVAGVIIIIVVIVAGVHCQCHCHRPWHKGQFQAKG